MNSSDPDNLTTYKNCSNSTVLAKHVLPVAYGFLLVGSMILNGLNAWIFIHVSSSRSFIVYLKSIVLADVLMSLTFPLKIISDSELGPWQIRLIVCRFSAVVFYLNMYIGIIFLGLISFDRYYKIVRPSYPSFFQTVKFSKLISTGIWALMIFLLVPNMILTSVPPTEETSKHCSKLKTPLGLRWHTVSSYFCVGFFWLVFLLLIYFYSSISRKLFSTYRKFRRNVNPARRRSHRNIFSIMFVFCVCFVPYHICRIPYTLTQIGFEFSCESINILFHSKEITLLMSAANVCLDPIIYFFLCQPFRRMLFTKMNINIKTSDNIEMSKSKRSQTIPEDPCVWKMTPSSS